MSLNLFHHLRLDAAWRIDPGRASAGGFWTCPTIPFELDAKGVVLARCWTFTIFKLWLSAGGGGSGGGGADGGIEKERLQLECFKGRVCLKSTSETTKRNYLNPHTGASMVKMGTFKIFYEGQKLRP